MEYKIIFKGETEQTFKVNKKKYDEIYNLVFKGE